MSAVTVCLLTYGDHLALVRQAVDSIRTHCARADYRLVVGANAVSPETRRYLASLARSGAIDRLLDSPVNLNKCPMMRQMFQDLETEFAWWFDDDSYIEDQGTLAHWLQAARAAPASTVLWGQAAYCGHPSAFTDLADALGFVRSAPWYRGLTPPSWLPGGKGEFNFRGQGTGDGYWTFVVGGCWMIRTAALRILDWPDPRLIKLGDDVLLGEAIRQHGWQLANVYPPGVAINTQPRRGDVGSCAPGLNCLNPPPGGIPPSASCCGAPRTLRGGRDPIDALSSPAPPTP
ncbi:MAG: hypothetical protein JXQ71_10320 [Verrucomicrobia bacterium]|nr:hypothetical protein [Verrucomicrobiota bacterium]